MLMDVKWPHANADFNRLQIEEYIVKLHTSDDLDIEFFKYGNSFKSSATLLTNELLKNQSIRGLDTYFFSIAYLYRHSLELILKAIAFKHIHDSEVRKDFLKDTFHNLSLILKRVVPFIKEQVQEDEEQYRWLSAYFEDMNDIDKESDSFRYPFSIGFSRNSNGEKEYHIKPFFTEQTHVNLVAFAYKMEIAFEIVECYYKKKISNNNNYKDYSPVFLEEGGSYNVQSVIGYAYARNRFFPYITAYIDCGKLLSQITVDSITKETIFFPMCYLYRNGIELAMKEILFEECSYNFQEAAHILKRQGHSFLGLWNKMKNDVISHSNGSENDEFVRIIEKYINQLHNFDGASDRFRYPIGKYLNYHFKNPVRLDISNVQNFFEELSNFFSGVCSMMSTHNEWIREMESEMRGYY